MSWWTIMNDAIRRVNEDGVVKKARQGVRVEA
jgi:hypothetical protein